MAQIAAIPLYPFQKKSFYDRSRFKVLLWSRQIGKDFTTGLEIVDDCFNTIAKGGQARWNIFAAGEEQAKRSLDDAIIPHCKAYGMAIKYLESDFNSDSLKYKVFEVLLPNNSIIRAYPTNPRTVRGTRGHAWINELSFIADSRKVWGAFYPTISSSNYRVIVTSTPEGLDNKFSDIWADKSGLWSKHFCDIHQAIAQGMPRDLEALRQGMGDDFLWEQEFLCIFQEGLGAWLSLDLIKSCEDARAIPDNYGGRPCFVGMDIGRKRDLSVIWVIEPVDDRRWTREIIPLERVTFREQKAELGRVMQQYNVRKAVLDSTGMGLPFVEDCQEEFGFGKIEGYNFSQTSKQTLAIGFKDQFESGNIAIPAGDEVLRKDLAKVKRKATANGNFVFAADRDSSGHADHFWAGALANYACNSPIILLPDMGTDGENFDPYSLDPEVLAELELESDYGGRRIDRMLRSINN
jgi:phage FluMu gp28-like protein